jgi:hypothetical protein
MATTRGSGTARTRTATRAVGAKDDRALKRDDKVKVNDKPGRVTGFSRGGDVYVRFDEKGAGLFPRDEVIAR